MVLLTTVLVVVVDGAGGGAGDENGVRVCVRVRVGACECSWLCMVR